jgi:hypothetical protein
MIDEAKRPNGDIQLVIRGKPSIDDRIFKDIDLATFRKRPSGELGIIYQSESKFPLLL